MKEKPILFKGDMVRAILEGRKTETRRIVKPQPESEGIRSYGESWKWINGKKWFSGVTLDQMLNTSYGLSRYCPYGQVGDRLWVRETWCDGYPGTKDPILYKASYEGGADHKWKPSIHMFRKFSRTDLEITEISVERVQDITDGAVAKEGVDWSSTQIGNKHGSPAIDKFALLWNSINEKRGFSWASNPWVWIIKFRLLK